MLFDPIYWLVIGAGMLLSFWASAKTKGTFAKYSKLPTSTHMTGAEVAQSILRDNDIHDVTVKPVAGTLTDHYNPLTKTLALSEPVYGGRSMAAFGVAAHEVGHAIQHARGYAMLKFRSAWVPVTKVSSSLSMFIIIAAAMMGAGQTAAGQGGLAMTLAWIGVAMFAATTVFTLITLPVEFDASRRALATLESGGYMNGEELNGARKVLNAAAMTYVAAFVASLLTLLYWAHRLGLLGGRRD